MEETKIEEARRLVAAHERGKENVEKVRQIIEGVYGLKAEYGTWYDSHNPPGVHLLLLSPTGHTVAEFALNWDQDGYVIPDRMHAGKGTITGLDEVRLAVTKLAPKGHRFCYNTTG
jgi:hypothetical protein